jgi:hypothetical protein
VFLLLVAALVAAGAMTGPARAQGRDDLDPLNHEIERLYGENKIAAAMPLAERYVALTRQRYGDENP